MKTGQRTSWTFLVTIGLLASIGCNDSSNDILNSSNDIEYVAIGASDAAGIGAEPLTDGYVYLISDRLDTITEGVSLRNLGIPGAESKQFLDVEVPVATELKPELITIWAGPNDIVGGVSSSDFNSTVDKMLSELTQKTSAFIVIATIPQLTKLPRFVEKPDVDVTEERISEYNVIIRALAAKYNVTIADLSRFQPTDTLVSDTDGFHPSNEGHKLLASIFLEVIEPVFTNTKK